MNIDGLATNPWIIALVTFIATVFITPLFSFLLRTLKSAFGAFSGQYLGLTGDFRSGPILLEDVKCRHVGSQVFGKIIGVATLDDDKNEGRIKESQSNKGKYRFSGFVDGRLLLISYHTTIRSAHSSGSLALKADSSGNIFSGRWVGQVDDNIETAPCWWIKLTPTISSKRRRQAFIQQAISYLEMPQDSSRPCVDKIRLVRRDDGNFGVMPISYPPIDET